MVSVTEEKPYLSNLLVVVTVMTLMTMTYRLILEQFSKRMVPLVETRRVLSLLY
jgi:hypothetical protein